MKKVVLSLFFLCVLFSFSQQVRWEDEFCDGGLPTDQINTTLSLNIDYFCDAGGDNLGLNQSYTEDFLGGGVYELNITIPPGGSNISLNITVPCNITLEYFNITFTGVVNETNITNPVGAALVTDVSGSMDDNCGGAAVCNELSCLPIGPGPGTCNDANGCKICDAKTPARYSLTLSSMAKSTMTPKWGW